LTVDFSDAMSQNEKIAPQTSRAIFALSESILSPAVDI